MKTLLRSALLLALLLVAGASSLRAAPIGFGRNKVQYDRFEWRVLESEHLQVHFYPQEEALAHRTVEIGEDACRRLSDVLGHRLTKKIPLVLYDSPARFRQNNVTPELIGEGTGGFTEIFRTRVVLPYSGSEPELDHVIRHELVHAFLFDYLYGGRVKSYFILQHAFYIPLWFAEGMAEYLSTTWDAEGEMMLRDAAISGGLPPFDRIYGGYFVYKSGHSAISFLTARYGPDVIARIVRALRESRDLRVAIFETTGATPEKIAEEWLREVRRVAWPTIEHLDDPDEVGRIVAKRAPGGFLTSNPALSPSGKSLVYLSDRDGTPDLFALDLERGEPRVLARGARSGTFESLHPLRSQTGWSSDEKYVVVVAQKESRDALYILDVADGRIVTEHLPELDAIEGPDWSPADARIVFTGMCAGQVDLYVMEPDGTGLTALTDDLFVERGARWSPDGGRVAFASDRDGADGLDLFTIDLATRNVERVVAAPRDQRDPTWRGSGREIVYVSEERGTRDLMALALDPGAAPRRLTALIGGADSPSAAWTSGRLAFAAYDRGGWDVVLVEDADTLAAPDAPPVEIPSDPWEGRVERAALSDSAVAAADSAQVAQAALAPVPALQTLLPEPPSVHDYRSRFRTEWLSGSLSYGPGGASGGVRTTVADILGDHRFDGGVQFFRRLEDSDAFVTYSYLPGRFDWHASVYHFKDFLYDDRTTLGQPIGEEDTRTFFSERRWGLAGGVTYPFDTFRRMSFEVGSERLERTTYTGDSRGFGANLELLGREDSSILLPRLALTHDNTLWGSTGPVQGGRSIFSVTHSVPWHGESISFGTLLADVRRYHRFKGRYSLAARALAAASFGEDPQQFQIGGPWTLRGYPARTARGSNTVQGSLEYRFPFLDRVMFGWPIRSSFGGVRGALFLDAATAFDHPQDFRGREMHAGPNRGLRDLKIGFGTGIRFRAVFFPVRLDVGWPFDLDRVGEPVWHLTIGPES